MVFGSLFPGGVFQVWNVMNNGSWRARGLEYLNGGFVRFLEWMRMPGDIVFISIGVVPMVIAATMALASENQSIKKCPRSGPLQVKANCIVDNTA
jgi:nitric oxide reductase subunit B